MPFYEITDAGLRPLSLAAAARSVYRALLAARPGARTRVRLIGLVDLVRELEAEEAEVERERERARYTLLELAAQERHRLHANGKREPVRTLEPRAWRTRRNGGRP